eukprot:338847_1
MSHATQTNGVDEFEFGLNQLNQGTLHVHIAIGDDSINCALGMSPTQNSFLLEDDDTTINGFAARFDCSDSGSVTSAAISIAYQDELYYVFQNKRLDFDDSDASCRFNYDEHLASIHNDDQNAEAIAKMSVYDAEMPVWFGLNDIETDGTWQNRDGTPWDYGLALGSSPWHTAQSDGGNVGDCATLGCELLYEKTGPIAFADGNCQGTVSIPDAFRMSFDFTINTWSNIKFTNSGYIHLFDINEGQPGEIAFRYGRLHESPYNGVIRLYFKFAASGNDVVLGSLIDPGNDDGKTFHLQAFVTQTTVMIRIDGTVVSDTAKQPHETLTDAPICFASANTVDGQIDNFSIHGMEWNDQVCQSDGYSLCNHPRPTVIINENYERSLSPDNLIGFIDILDEVYVEFDIVINTWPSSWANVLHIGTGASHERFPAIFIHPSWAKLQLSFGNIYESYYSVISTLGLIPNTQYHFTLYRTQQHMTITVNGVKVLDEATLSHPLFFNRPIYVSNPWQNAADVAVSNLFISTSNSHSPNEFNYLCDAENRLSIANGGWTFDINECTVQSTNSSELWNVLWLGDDDPSSMYWTDYIFEVKFIIHNGTTAVNLLFRTQSVSSTTDRDGYFLSVALNATDFGVFSENATHYFTKSTAWQWEFNVTYSVRIEILGSHFAFYRNDEFLFSSADSNMTFTSGTIGLNT